MKLKPTFARISGALILAAFAASPAMADVVFVTCMTSNCTSTTVCGNGRNADVNPFTGNKVYSDDGAWGGYTSTKAASTEPCAVVPGSMYFSNSFSNSVPTNGITLSPALGVPGAIYKVYSLFTSGAGNTTTNVVLGVTNVENCTLSFTTTDKLQRKYGVAPQPWQLWGFLTNAPGTSNPRIRLYFVGGTVSAGTSQRLVLEQFKFEYYDPCTDVPKVSVDGPLAANNLMVKVANVATNASAVTVYMDTGAGMTQIGQITSGIVPGNNLVPVTSLVKGAKVAATQTINGTEGCKPLAGFGTVVGGGANPPIRICLSVTETTATPTQPGQPLGANSNIHFMGASTTSGGAPVDAAVYYPSGTWQTVTFQRTVETIGNASNVVGAVVAPSSGGYSGADTVKITVYAYRTYNGTQLFSKVGAASTSYTSNEVFGVNWTWQAVPGAEGYKLLREWNQTGTTITAADITGANAYADINDGNAWQADATIGATFVQTSPSVQWNVASGETAKSYIPGTWGALDAIALTTVDGSDTGPYDIYIDDLQNGSTVIDSWDEVPAGLSGYGLQYPGTSGTTSGNILPWNVGDVSNLAAYNSTKSFRVQFQFSSTVASSWVRLTAYAALQPLGNTGTTRPALNFDQPISFKMLMLPAGSPAPTGTGVPVLTASLVNGKTVLNWNGGRRLQASPAVGGTYTNITQPLLPPNTNAYVGPWTNSFTDPMMFFRLRD